MKKSVKVTLISLFALAPLSQAIAFEAGDWVIQGGMAAVVPKSNNGTVLNEAKLDVDNSYRPHGTIAYMVTPNIGVELLVAVPFKHNIEINGQNLAETKHLPPTLSAQYHFTQHEQFQPYVGVGVNYTNFFDTKTKGDLRGNDLSIDNSVGIAGQIGLNYRINESWHINTEARYISIESDVKLNGTKIGKAEINPWVFGVALGYRF